VLNKIDVIKVEDLRPDDRALIENIGKDGTEMISMSTLTEEGVSRVKQVVSKFSQSDKSNIKRRATNCWR
jgi:hypothetical protein